MSGSVARQFWRERDEDDSTAGGLLPPAEVVDDRRPQMLALVCSARSVRSRQVRPFHVDARDRRRGLRRKHTGARSKVLEQMK